MQNRFHIIVQNLIKPRQKKEKRDFFFGCCDLCLLPSPIHVQAASTSLEFGRVFLSLIFLIRSSYYTQLSLFVLSFALLVGISIYLDGVNH